MSVMDLSPAIGGKTKNELHAKRNDTSAAACALAPMRTLETWWGQTPRFRMIRLVPDSLLTSAEWPCCTRQATAEAEWKRFHPSS